MGKKKQNAFTFTLNGSPLTEPNPFYAPHLRDLHVSGCDSSTQTTVVYARSPYHAVITLYNSHAKFRHMVEWRESYVLQVHMKANRNSPKRHKSRTNWVGGWKRTIKVAGDINMSECRDKHYTYRSL